MAACPECGTVQDAGRFCGRCGAALPTPASADRDDPAPEDLHAWEDRDPASRRPLAVGVVLALVAVIAVAVVVSRQQEADPGQGPAAPGSPVTTSLSTPGPAAPLAAPALPVTTAGDCPDRVPGCAAWHTDFPGAEGVTPPVLGTDPRHVYLGGFLTDRTGALYAVDPGNGIQLWRRRLPGIPRLPLVTPWRTVAVVYDDPRSGSGVREFDPETGEIRWQAEAVLASRATVPPAAAGHTLAVAGPGRMLLRHLDGNTVTIVEIAGSPTRLLATGDGDDTTFLVQTASGEVMAYAPDGSIRWGQTNTEIATAISRGRTALLELPGYVVGVDVRSGELWRARVDVAQTAPVVMGESAFVVTRDGEIVRLSLDDGRELGRVRFQGLAASAPFAVERDRAYVPTCAGVAAHDLETGEQVWRSGLDAPEGACADGPVVGQGSAVELLVTVANRLYGLVPEPSVP